MKYFFSAIIFFSVFSLTMQTGCIKFPTGTSVSAPDTTVYNVSSFFGPVIWLDNNTIECVEWENWYARIELFLGWTSIQNDRNIRMVAYSSRLDSISAFPIDTNTLYEDLLGYARSSYYPKSQTICYEIPAWGHSKIFYISLSAKTLKIVAESKFQYLNFLPDGTLLAQKGTWNQVGQSEMGFRDLFTPETTTIVDTNGNELGINGNGRGVPYAQYKSPGWLNPHFNVSIIHVRDLYGDRHEIRSLANDSVLGRFAGGTIGVMWSDDGTKFITYDSDGYLDFYSYSPTFSKIGGFKTPFSWPFNIHASPNFDKIAVSNAGSLAIYDLNGNQIAFRSSKQWTRLIIDEK